MKRVLAVLVTVLLVGGGYLLLRHSEVYRASDPALLAATGRPQLVEFYHPG